LKIATITIFWDNSGGKNLTDVFLNGIQIWGIGVDTNASGISLPGGPWTLNTGANPLRLVFSNNPMSSMRVIVTLADQYNCGTPLDSDNPNQKLPLP